jgi:quinoprotein glucose dehydrogenase
MRGRIALVLAAGVALWTVAGSAADKSSEWPAYSGDKGSTKYSALDQINRATIKGLKIAWRQSSVPDELKTLFPDAQGSTNWQNTPTAGGLLYMSSAVGTVVALDPSTGKVVWFDVPPHEEGKPPARAGSTRGVAYWANGSDSRIFAMNGPNLIVLNAKTGKRYPGWGTNGQVDLTKVGHAARRLRTPQQQRPDVVRDVVVVGGVPAPATDYLNERVKATKEAPPDDIRGFDAKTGKHRGRSMWCRATARAGVETWLNDSHSIREQRRVVAAERG